MMKKKQYIVFGGGRFGSSVASTLQQEGCEVVVVDKDPDLIQSIANDVGYAICGNVEDSELFDTLGLHNMDGAIISLTESLEASIVATMMCHEKRVPMIVAKAKSRLHEKILYSVGATQVIFPELEMGRRLAKHIVADNFMDWIDLSSEFSLVEMSVPAAWQGRSLAQLHIREKYQVNVIGLKTGDKVSVTLDPNEPLPATGVLIVAGENKNLEALRD